MKLFLMSMAALAKPLPTKYVPQCNSCGDGGYIPNDIHLNAPVDPAIKNARRELRNSINMGSAPLIKSWSEHLDGLLSERNRYLRSLGF